MDNNKNRIAFIVSDFILLGCVLLFLDVEVVDSGDVNFACGNLIFQEVQIFFLLRGRKRERDIINMR